MTTGTVTLYNSTRGTGTVACGSGGRFPFTSHAAGLEVGDRVSFRAVGGRTGTYALEVVRLEAAPPVRMTAGQIFAAHRPMQTAGSVFAV
ncbi:cold-shock protein [Rubrivirga sp.]|uniref:cold-shock protein n=1 Tax=Rubrivirga sp. TaxID=1885344 RepID=UPI003C77C2D8